MDHFAACALTGQEADLDGVCVEHGAFACVKTVEVPPVYECEIPGFQCTHRHEALPVRRRRVFPH